MSLLKTGMELAGVGSSSSVALVIANLVPLFGVIFLGWDTFSLLLVFWLENIVIGLFNIMRMAVSRAQAGPPPGQKLFFIPFFVIHYGGFTMVHGIFLMTIFGKIPGLESEGLANLAQVVWQQIQIHHLGWSLLALTASHGFSFMTNTIGAGEYRYSRLDKLMAQPYSRVMIMHATVLLGAFLAQSTGNSKWALVVMVIAKMAADLRGHKAEHKKSHTKPLESKSPL